MTKMNDRSAARQKKLQEAHAELDDIMVKMAQPDVQKDKSENSEYDILEAQRKSVTFRIKKILDGNLAPFIPGTYNVDDMLYVTYSRIVSYGKDVPVPANPVLIKLVDDFNITKLTSLVTFDDSEEIREITTSTDLGKALINNAHKKVRFNTKVGYCEVEVERA